MGIRRQIITRSIDIPLYKSFRRFGRPLLPPVHITFGITHRCPWNCLTCHCEDSGDEMSSKEYLLLARSVKFSPFSVALTGGEPLARTELLKIATLISDKLRPSVIFIETCGAMPVRLQRSLRSLTSRFPGVHYVAVLSMPASGARFDELRGAEPGAFETFLRSYSAVRALGMPNLTTAINIPVSHHNAAEARTVIDNAHMLYPDVVAIQPVYGSEELGVVAAEVMPEPGAYKSVLEYYLAKTARSPARGFNRVLWRIARRSARTAFAAIDRMRQPSPCQAAHASIYISPRGSVLDCPVAAREMGDLRENQYDLVRILSCATAAAVRKNISASQCFCPMESTVLPGVLLSPALSAGLLASVV